MKGFPRRRFWTLAEVTTLERGFGIRLDERELQTPAKLPLVVPTWALAAAIAAEWNGLTDEILPDRLPLTRAANAAIDRVEKEPGAVVDLLASYGGADLLCYRAETPDALRARQAAAWDPPLLWSADYLGAPLNVFFGVVHREQPQSSLAALRAVVAAHDAFGLTALHDLVTLSGSLVLGLGVSRGALTGVSAWDLSRVDETWQAEQWGVDAEAEAAAAPKRRAFLQAEDLILLLRDPESA